MPNHIHGIIGIDKPDDVFKNDNDNIIETRHTIVETLHATSLQMSDISPQFGSLSSIVRSFKSAVTKYANKNDIPFKWQTRFYDRVIRDEKELGNIQNYIISNPVNWEKEKYYIN